MKRCCADSGRWAPRERLGVQTTSSVFFRDLWRAEALDATSFDAHWEYSLKFERERLDLVTVPFGCTTERVCCPAGAIRSQFFQRRAGLTRHSRAHTSCVVYVTYATGV